MFACMYIYIYIFVTDVLEWMLLLAYMCDAVCMCVCVCVPGEQVFGEDAECGDR